MEMVDDHSHSRVAEEGEETRFGLARGEVEAARLVARMHALQDDGCAGLDVVSAVDRAHVAAAEARVDLVAAEPGLGESGSGRGVHARHVNERTSFQVFALPASVVVGSYRWTADASRSASREGRRSSGPACPRSSSGATPAASFAPSV